MVILPKQLWIEIHMWAVQCCVTPTPLTHSSTSSIPPVTTLVSMLSACPSTPSVSQPQLVSSEQIPTTPSSAPQKNNSIRITTTSDRNLIAAQLGEISAPPEANGRHSTEPN